MPSRNLSYTANTKVIPYSITVNLDGGTTPETIPTTYNVESDDITLPQPSKEGYVFEGWTGSNGDTPEKGQMGILTNNIENVKGVVRFLPNKDTDTIYGIDIRVSDETIQELKKYVKGYFFVRQTRIPTILCQGITIGVDQNSYTPCVATADGYLNDLSEQLEKTHVESNDINDVNYISEGFLKRYSFEF
jgi:uncharacterized repeat protein (TIGR02543 family)